MRGESVQLHENDSGASSSGRSPSGVRTPDALAPVVPQHDARRDVVDPVGGPDDGDVRREARDREDVAEIDGRGGDGRDRALPGSADAAHHEEQIHRGHGREEGAEHHVKGILYESCPGVSACFGAAALLNLEYTLPEVSQSLIITRMEGRTKVPERESIESFAAHHASMAIYLSTGMIGELGRRLIAGGYGKDTPAAIVYKATWPEEEAYLCTVEQLEETAKAHDITKTALIIVGDIVAHQHYGKSRLYAPDFETEFRKIKKSREKE